MMVLLVNGIDNAPYSNPLSSLCWYLDPQGIAYKILAFCVPVGGIGQFFSTPCGVQRQISYYAGSLKCDCSSVSHHGLHV